MGEFKYLILITHIRYEIENNDHIWMKNKVEIWCKMGRIANSLAGLKDIAV